MRIIRIRHVTLAVRDIERARSTFAALFGAENGESTASETLGVRRADLSLGAGTLRLAAPLTADSPLRRFLDRKGEAVYSVAFEVGDLDAAVAELRAQGVRVSDPAEVEPGARSAFVAMAATHGLSVQLVQAELAEDAARPESDPAETAQPVAPRPLDLTPDEWSDVD
jgi:methylmalonyl-CoA/ethylmalonyl-CoA epimerase